MFLTFLFLIIFLVGVAIEFSGKRRRQEGYLLFVVAIVTLWSGIRIGWPDQEVYAAVFSEAPNIYHISEINKITEYNETGFKLLTMLLRTFSDSTTFYFTLVSAITMFFLYKGDKSLAPYPIMGMMVYVARFFLGRNMTQIRAGISYAILLLAVRYIYERDWKRFFLITFIAYEFHHSAIIAIPIYFLCNWFHFQKRHIYIGLAFAFIFGIFGQGIAHSFIEDNASDLNIGARYTLNGGEEQFSKGLGMRNPMIYFQSLLLVAYTFLETRLASKFKYYYVLRTGYFYSTLILICFCSYSTLSGRTSTLFATYEIAIIPSMIYLMRKRDQQLAALAIALLVTGIFYMNFTRFVIEP